MSHPQTGQPPPPRRWSRASWPPAAAAALSGCAVALAAGLLAAPAAQARYSAADGILSPRLAKLSRPAVAPLPADRQASAVGLPGEGPGSLQREGRRVLVEVGFDHGAIAGLEHLRAAGAQVLGASRRRQTATVAVKPGGLPALDRVPGASSAREVLQPQLAAVCPSGAVVSEGDAQLGAPAARADFGVDGSGVDVGVLSDSFGTAPEAATSPAKDVSEGDLPGAGNPCGDSTPVGILKDYEAPSSEFPEPTDEGRGMAQIIHDLAPGAAIDFATAEGGEEIFAEHIRELAQAGTQVIVDDVAYFEEPFFQDGPVATAIDEVVGDGVTYLTAAGNDNLETGEGDGTGKRYASWETPEFRDSAEGCPKELEEEAPHPDHCLDFNPGSEPGEDDPTFGITVERKETLIVDLQWGEPWEGVEADLDAYLLDSSDKPIPGASSTNDSVGEGRPFEFIAWENTKSTAVEVRLAIDRCFSTEKEKEEDPLSGCNYQASETAKPPVKVLLAENGRGVSGTEYEESSGPDVVGPTIYGHAGSPAALTVGAVGVTGTGLKNEGTVETYSSRGPVRHLFGPVTGKEPAPPLEETIAKPDIAASDCGHTTFFFSSNNKPPFRFCGTSAAAPHAAAVVALALQADPSATPAKIAAGLAETASPVGSFGEDAIGAGLVQAYGLIDVLALPPKVSFPGAPALTNDPRPAIGFAANRPASFTCSLDGAPATPCASPFVPEAALFDGPHRLRVRAVDLGGRPGEGETRFTVDTVAPRTFFAHRPRHNLRLRRHAPGHGKRAAFRFGSNEAGARFVCRIDNGLFHFCPALVRRRFGVGRHAVRVKALDAAGNLDPTAAVFRFRVRRVGSHR
jgi:Subtilase family